MRITHKACAQHLGWMFKKHWQVQGKRSARELGPPENLMKGLELEVKDSSSVADNKPSHLPYIFKTTSNLHNTGYVLLDTNIISQGLKQALFLTKTIKIDGFPKQIEQSIKNTELSDTNHKNIKDAILESFYYDAQQEKTPIIKNPERKAYILPRTYGITDFRRNQLMVTKLISECEKIAGKMISVNRKIVNNDISVVSFEKNGQTIQLNIFAETVISSKRPLQAVKDNYEGSIPDLYPLNYTISIPRKPISTTSSSILHRKDSSYSNPHTIFLHCSPSEMINMHGTPITESQFEARNLLKAFGIAISKARQIHGEIIQHLPHPVVVQTIQTDGKTFHFGIFQLNTLDLNGSEGITNFWFSTSNKDLFNFCGKRTEKPILDYYNKIILTTMSVFYNNS